MPEKFHVEITPSAESDVEEIWTFIAQDSPAKASAFISELESQVSDLERFPLRCPLIPENEILGTHYRHLLYGDYRTIFKISGNIVYILRIVHGSRLLDDSFFD